MTRPPGVLFWSEAGAGRGPLAEGLARARFGERVRVTRGSRRPGAVAPQAIAMLRERGIEPAPEEPLAPEAIDLVVSLCAGDAGPELGRPVRRLCWPLPDPVALAAAGEGPSAFRGVRRMLAHRLDALEPALAMPEGVTLRPAVDADRDALVELLVRCALPADGLDDAFPRGAVVAELDGALVGSAAAEQWDVHGLLRSVAVAPAWRGRRLGAALVADRVAWARSLLRDGETVPFASVSLLTTSAADFFERYGFAPVERGALPPSLAASAELRLACCASATAMRLTFHESEAERTARGIAEELAAHGTVVPPWVKYPDLPRRSIGWRMGGGEAYLALWWAWWRELAAADRDAYRARWPEPDAWRGWLATHAGEA